jgi:uncharacterized OB-fold protein
MTAPRPQRLAAKPEPRPSVTSQPFWTGCAAGELRLPRCRACGTVHFYPRPACPGCGGDDLEWIVASGRGTVHSTTVVHRSFWGDAWAADVPYEVALIRLDEGVQLVSTVIGVPPGDVHIGMRVTVEFEPRGESWLPVFRPFEEAS